MGKLVNCKIVGADNICGELLKLGRNEDSAILECLHNIVLTVWRQEVEPQESEDAIINALFKRKVRQLPRCFARISRVQGGSQDSYNSPQRPLRPEGSPPRSPMWLPTQPVDGRHDVRRAQTLRTGQREESSAAHVPHRRPKGIRLSGLPSSLECASTLRYTREDDFYHPLVP